ncbi:MAG: hypothetical protein IKM99_10340 [Bacteroidales bacterium]|nr:hypothetical protein [Bacteroidales bacterium]
MKLHKLLLFGTLILFCSHFNNANAQLFKGEAFAGASLSQVDGDECFGYNRFNGQLGAGVLLSLTEKDWLDLGLEIVYNPKGALRSDTLIGNSGHFRGTYDVKLNYVEIPLMVYFTDKHRYTVGLGASYGRLVGLSEKINGVATDIRPGDGYLRWKDGYEGSHDIDLSEIRTLEDLSASGLYDDTQLPPTIIVQNSNSYSKHDISICADFRIRIWEGFHAQLRYQYSLRPIRIRLFEEYNPQVDYKVRKQYNNQISLRLTYIFGEDLSKLNRDIQKEEKKRNR